MTIAAPAQPDYYDTTLIDITAIPLRELRRVSNPDLADTIRQAHEAATLDQASAIQDQRE